MEYLQMS